MDVAALGEQWLGRMVSEGLWVTCGQVVVACCGAGAQLLRFRGVPVIAPDDGMSIRVIRLVARDHQGGRLRLRRHPGQRPWPIFRFAVGASVRALSDSPFPAAFSVCSCFTGTPALRRCRRILDWAALVKHQSQSVTSCRHGSGR